MARIDLHLADELADALTIRAAEMNLSRSELLRRLASAFAGVPIEDEVGAAE